MENKALLSLAEYQKGAIVSKEILKSPDIKR